MRKYATSAGLAFLLLAACDSGTDEDVVTGEGPAPEEDLGTLVEEPSGPAEVSVLQTLGQFEGFVSDIAAMEDPALGFRGRILAANADAGIQMISPEGRSLGAIPGPAPDAIAVSYAVQVGNSGTVLGYRARQDASVVEAYRPDGARLDDLFPAGSFTTGPGVRDLCSVGGVIIAIDGRGDAWRGALPMRRAVDPDTAEAAAAIQKLDGLSEVTGCYETPAGVIATGERGALLILPDALEPVGIDPRAAEVVETEAGLVSVRIDDGLIVIDGNPVRLTRDDGQPLRARMIRIVGGNFGGVLRDGLVLVLGEDNSLHTLGWSTIANAVGANRQALTLRPPQTPSGDPRFSIDGPDATLEARDLRQPEFEEREAQLPPSDGG
jgi:hypothetical protein